MGTTKGANKSVLRLFKDVPCHAATLHLQGASKLSWCTTVSLWFDPLHGEAHAKGTPEPGSFQPSQFEWRTAKHSECATGRHWSSLRLKADIEGSRTISLRYAVSNLIPLPAWYKKYNKQSMATCWIGRKCCIWENLQVSRTWVVAIVSKYGK